MKYNVFHFFELSESHPPIRRNPDEAAQRPRSARQGFRVSATTKDKTYHEERVTAAHRRRERGALFSPEPSAFLRYNLSWPIFPNIILELLTAFMMHGRMSCQR